MMRKLLLMLVLTTACVATTRAASVDSALIIRPKESGTYQGDRDHLIARGEALWNDKSLSGKGKTSCASCHGDNTKMFKKTFLDAYPHPVKMVSKKAKLDQITTEGMVQFCMVVPMKNEPLPWDSEELAALSAYSEAVVQKAYVEKKGK